MIDSDLLEEVRHHVDWFIAHNSDHRPEKLDKELVADDPFWLHLVRNDRILNIAEQFIGPNIALFTSHYIAKPPVTIIRSSFTKTAHTGRSIPPWRSLRSASGRTTRTPKTVACVSFPARTA